MNTQINIESNDHLLTDEQVISIWRWLLPASTNSTIHLTGNQKLTVINLQEQPE